MTILFMLYVATGWVYQLNNAVNCLRKNVPLYALAGNSENNILPRVAGFVVVICLIQVLWPICPSRAEGGKNE